MTELEQAAAEFEAAALEADRLYHVAEAATQAEREAGRALRAARERCDEARLKVLRLAAPTFAQQLDRQGAAPAKPQGVPVVKAAPAAAPGPGT